MPLTHPNPDEQITLNRIPFSHADIRRVVDGFYRRVELDPVLAVPFRSVENWPAHIQHMTHFWWIRFGGRAYLETSYNPVEKHSTAGFNLAFLSRWLTIFQDTLESTLNPEQAHLWGIVAERIGQSLSMKNDYYRREYENELAKQE
jgi:hemoglobin